MALYINKIDKNDTIKFRLSSKDKQDMEKEAESIGLSVSAFIRMLFRRWVLSGGIIAEKRENHDQSTTSEVSEVRKSVIPGE